MGLVPPRNTPRISAASAITGRAEIWKCELPASMRPACAFPRRALAGPSHMRSVSGEKQRNTSKAAFPAASVMVPGVGSPVLTNQACKARLEYCKRVIAPVLGAHHDHPGKVAGAIWRDCSSRYGSSGMGLGWRQSGTRRLRRGDSGHARWLYPFGVRRAPIDRPKSIMQNSTQSTCYAGPGVCSSPF